MNGRGALLFSAIVFGAVVARGHRLIQTISKAVQRFAYEPGEAQEARSEKNAILLVASSCIVAGAAWAAMYAVVFGDAITTLLPLLFVVVVGTSVLVSHFMNRHKIAVYTQITSIILVTTAIQWSIGGLFDSGFVIMWAFIGPLAALMFLSAKESIAWFALYLVVLVATVAFDDSLSARALESSAGLRRFFSALNLGVSSVVVFAFAGYFVKSMARERSAANRLLLNVLPAQIAERLKTGGGTIADQYESVSVLFADAVDSTPIFAELEPTQVVDWLNEVFTAFDEIVERHGLEKLRTIGDGYMVGAGVPEGRDDHASALVACSLDLIEVLDEIPPRNGRRMKFRFGINSGQVVAGVIGTSKFHYDMWGDAVNVASRMESSGEVGRIHISQSTFDQIEERFTCVSRGRIPVKGKGDMQTWFVVGRRAP